MRRPVVSLMICLVGAMGVSYFMAAGKEQQVQMSDQDVRQFMERQAEVVKVLMSIAKQELKPNPARAAWAIEMLGQLRATEAVDFLVDNIAFRSPYENEPMSSYVAVWALKAIGYPSVQAVIYRGFWKERTLEEQKLIAMVIREVFGGRELGERVGRLVIEEHLRSAPPSYESQRRLKKFTETFFRK